MATIVVMPQLGNSVESCLINEWEVSVGDAVAVDQVLCSIETDKATMDVPSTDAGTVLKLLWEVGDEVPVKDPLLILGEPGEEISEEVLAQAGVSGDSNEAASAPEQEAPAEEEKPEAPSFQTAASGGAISPRARALADSEGLDPSAVSEGSGPHGRVLERDVKAYLAENPATNAARAQGATGTGTGLGGRVTTADLASPAADEAAAAPLISADADFPGPSEAAPLKGIRKVVATRMMESLAETAQLSYTVSAKADKLMAMRKRFKQADESLGVNAITIGDLVGYAVVKTIAKYPTFNAHLADGTYTKFQSIHLGVAVDTPRGLLVPVIRGANAMNLKEFSAASKQVAGDSIDGTISPDLLNGGTFTVTNLGSFGVETFTPIINRPQVAILGVAAVTPRAALDNDGNVVVEKRIGFSLTADHQVIDGADAARFLRDLVNAIENIDLTVLG
ncbi:MAG: 2-oxo acid dehydrogenase subunit E2 [Actinomycetaceae bacterium]|nr:2-oxo acid dehydrogenase subunit E2 [Actinomycetaceae bacterium]